MPGEDRLMAIIAPLARPLSEVLRRPAVRDAMLLLPGSLMGRLVMRASGIGEPTRVLRYADVGDVYLVEDRRLGRYLDTAPVRPFAQTLGRYVLARETIPDDLIRHEVEHVRQYARLGPFYLAAYGIASGVALLAGRDAYRYNVFEIAAAERQANPDG